MQPGTGLCFWSSSLALEELMSKSFFTQEKGMKESVSELVLFAAETKLKSRTLQLIEIILDS